MLKINAEALSQRLIDARTNAGLSQPKVAEGLDEELGVSQSFVSSVERGVAAFTEMNIARIKALGEKLGFEIPYEDKSENGQTEPGRIVKEHFSTETYITPTDGVRYEIEVLQSGLTALERLDAVSRRRVLAYWQDVFSPERKQAL